MPRVVDSELITLIENKFLSKQTLTAAQLNNVYTLLKGGVNENYEDIKRILNVGDGETDEGLFNYAEFNTSPTLSLTPYPGQLFYDKDFRTFSFRGTLGNKHEIGQNLEGLGKADNRNGPFKHHEYWDAEIVTWSGAQGDHKLFIPADASVPEQSTMIGVLTTLPSDDPENFAIVSVFGEVGVSNFETIMEFGEVSNINFGTKLYLSAAVPGKFSVYEPDFPNAAIWVATVVDYNEANNKGKIFVYPIRTRIDSSTRTYLQSSPPYPKAGDLWFDTNE